MSMIRAMRRNEIDRLLHWAKDEGWNPGRNDAELFWNLDPEGFLAIDVNDEMVGGGAIIRHNAAFGFMGLFLMQPSNRGQGLGTELWYARRDRLLERLQPGGTIGLDAVDQMIPFYARGGFDASFRHRRFEWQPIGRHDLSDHAVVDLSSVDWETVASLDKRCFPGKRERFLRNWCGQQGAVSLAVHENNSLHGFGVMRPASVGWKIGPLFAEDKESADLLLQAFASKVGSGPIFLDVPDSNPQGIEICEANGMKEVFGCVRMYYGTPPGIDHERIFAVTTLEVG
ncbi:GNAT family N-acetyltransferase [bacterium]|nr:GNAT family N-acetyltransferase [bacterium]